MKSTRPYLIRAFYDWIVDNDCTPHVVVNAEMQHVEVPIDYVENGQIVLNVSMTAVKSLRLGDDAIEFEARFNGVPHVVYVPAQAVMAIYAKENGRGMVFADDDNLPPEGEGTSSNVGSSGVSTKASKGEKPHLTVVK